jgi:isocitrate dehydrogenase
LLSEKVNFPIREDRVEKKVVYFIEGDGIGAEVTAVALPVIDAAVRKAYGEEKRLEWRELLAGEKAHQETGEYLPQATLNALKEADLAIKGPLTTPVGAGIRSLNVTLRQTFDLYACIRPIRYFKGVDSPVKRPELTDMVVFRENTEDVYAGVEWPANSKEAVRLLEFLRDEMGAALDTSCGVGIKPISEKGSKRLVRRALAFAVAEARKSVTLVHKGNIMKFTEGAFRGWGYEVAKEEFSDVVMTEAEAKAGAKMPVVINDVIADAMFQQVLLYPGRYDVVATTNLNGDYISDALAAQVGGLGMAPGVNMGDSLAIYEATHGAAPDIAGQDKANPSSLVLSGAMMLRGMGWAEAADLMEAAVQQAIEDKKVTCDLALQMEGASEVGCKAFGELLVAKMG